MRLERALATLKAHDDPRRRQKVASASAPDQKARRELVLEAGEALWYFVIQRELTGFHDSLEVMRDYQVPKEVKASMGLRPPARS